MAELSQKCFPVLDQIQSSSSLTLRKGKERAGGRGTAGNMDSKAILTTNELCLEQAAGYRGLSKGFGVQGRRVMPKP